VFWVYGIGASLMRIVIRTIRVALRSKQEPAVSKDESTINIVAEEGHSRSPWKLPARWRVEVRGKGGSQQKFKAAIAHDGHLELIEEIAPYDKEFSASRLIALFESGEEGSLSVVAFSDASGVYRQHCSFSGGRSGRILFDSNIPAYQADSL
jgi:hypothetical protein